MNVDECIFKRKGERNHIEYSIFKKEQENWNLYEAIACQRGVTL